MKMRFISSNNFCKLCEQYPAILFPAIQLKKYLREQILGFRFWKPLCDYRQKFYDDHSITISYIPVRVLLIYPQDAQAITKYIEKRENINPLRAATLRNMSVLVDR